LLAQNPVPIPVAFLEKYLWFLGSLAVLFPKWIFIFPIDRGRCVDVPAGMGVANLSRDVGLRKEGDQGNAAYWYSRAGKPVCREPLEAEWVGILKTLLGY